MEIKTTIYWAVHPNEVQNELMSNSFQIDKLIEKINSDNSTLLVTNYSRPPMEISKIFPNKYNRNNKNRLNHFSFLSGTKGKSFPNLNEIKELEKFVKKEFNSSLSESQFYLFGGMTGDCVPRTASALIYGLALEACLGNKIIIDWANNPIQNSKYVDVIQELTFPVMDKIRIDLYGFPIRPNLNEEQKDNYLIIKPTIPLQSILN